MVHQSLSPLWFLPTPVHSCPPAPPPCLKSTDPRRAPPAWQDPTLTHPGPTGRAGPAVSHGGWRGLRGEALAAILTVGRQQGGRHKGPEVDRAEPRRETRGWAADAPTGQALGSGAGGGCHPRATAPAAVLGSCISGGIGVGLPVAGLGCGLLFLMSLREGQGRRAGTSSERPPASRGPGAPRPACALGFTLRAASSGLGTALGLQGPPQVMFSPTPQGAAPAPLLHNISKLR